MQFRFSKYRLVLGTVFLSLVGTLAYTQTEVRIRELTEVEADGISNEGAIWFGVDKTDVPASRKISLTELKKRADVVVVATVADLATASAVDERIYQTLGYTVAGTGANMYRYDADSAATANGGTVIAGPGSVGRYIAIDQSKVDVTQFGAIGDDVADDTEEIQAALDIVTDNHVYIPPGIYKITSTLTLPSAAYWFTIEGAGNASRLHYTPTDGTACLDLNGSQHFRLKNFMVAGDAEYANCVGIDFNSGARWSVEDVEVRNATTGVDFEEAFIGAITNLYVRYCTTAFIGSAMNDVHGIVKTENCYKHFDLDDSFVVDLKLIGEGPARTTTAALDGCFNISLDCYFEDNAGEKPSVPEITVGATTRCANVDIRLSYPNVSGPSKVFTADDTTDECTSVAHGFSDGTLIRLTTTSALPAGLATGPVYYVVSSAADTFQLAKIPSGSAIDITGTGTGVHTASFLQDRYLIALDDVFSAKVNVRAVQGTMHKAVSTTSDTKNLEITGVDTLNVPTRPILVPATYSTLLPVNYFPDPLFLNAIPTLTNSNTTSAEDTSVKPDFCARSIRIESTGSVTSNIAYTTLTFAKYPHLAELKGRKFGVGWWQYYDSTATYSPTSTGNGPQVRVYPNGTSPTNSAERYSMHYRGAWHFVTSEGVCPSDATQIIVYYYSNAGAQTSDASMISYFVGPLIWIGGQDNVEQVLAGKYTHHPSALTYTLQTASPVLAYSSIALTNGAAAQTATMTNGPTAGNPTKWIPINDNGTTRYIPAW